MAQIGVQKCEKVIEVLKNVWPDFNIHTDDLHNPTPASVCKFYEKLLDELGIDVEQITMKLTEHMSSPDSNQDIIHYYVLYRCLKGFFERLKLKSPTQPFTISDILRPTPEITKIRVMVIANFLLYSKKLVEQTLQPIENRIKEEPVQIDAMNKELDDLGTYMNTLAVKLCDIEKSLGQLQKEREEYLQKYEELRQMYEGILQDNEKVKQEYNELEAERYLLMDILRNETAKKDELNQAVVGDSRKI